MLLLKKTKTKYYYLENKQKNKSRAVIATKDIFLDKNHHSLSGGSKPAKQAADYTRTPYLDADRLPRKISNDSDAFFLKNMEAGASIHINPNDTGIAISGIDGCSFEKKFKLDTYEYRKIAADLVEVLDIPTTIFGGYDTQKPCIISNISIGSDMQQHLNGCATDKDGNQEHNKSSDKPLSTNKDENNTHVAKTHEHLNNVVTESSENEDPTSSEFA
ncbi:hypothetical protein AX774_g5841 [Zancudomyces culisetae]|uniref:Uncharacterized protein n=1 Tax=Zancudomyces culisetae TaxID=1213189 RepID=A0A1R1PIH8_ZANCU|nr:hypothetical protein AX774_g5841 [Zancudomyces culisetae]|eukprot:OMH80713.1 hypothetical protein AX774_g5841 [Zancudomyces culisetae]